MQIQLSGKAAKIVKEQVAAGFYGSATEFVSDIVLRTDEFNRLKLERLRREVNIGLEEIKRGEVVEFDLEDIQDVLVSESRNDENTLSWEKLRAESKSKNRISF
jgi:Arc/MetJ-type ribon-helix-helix transcriptional regulator